MPERERERKREREREREGTEVECEKGGEKVRESRKRISCIFFSIILDNLFYSRTFKKAFSDNKQLRLSLDSFSFKFQFSLMNRYWPISLKSRSISQCFARKMFQFQFRFVPFCLVNCESCR